MGSLVVRQSVKQDLLNAELFNGRRGKYAYNTGTNLTTTAQDYRCGLLICIELSCKACFTL